MEPSQSKPAIPAWLIWIQCIAFVVLYAVWILPEIVGIRNTALVVGALAGLYPIYQCRGALLKKGALPIWMMAALFFWATFHLLFLSQDYAAQFLEFKRIWKYAAIGAIFAFGLGISLIDSASQAGVNQEGRRNSSAYWGVVYLGLCGPVLIYLLKYALSTYGASWGLSVPDYLKIYFSSARYYVPKTDYVAFCLPTLAVALGQAHSLLKLQVRFRLKEYCWFAVNVAMVSATLFLFYVQDIKNGMAYSALCIGLFVLITLFTHSGIPFWKKLLGVTIGVSILVVGLLPHVQKNDSWRTLAADTKIALQTDQYQHWKYAGAQGYPNNEFGKMVSVTNYERVAWLRIGSRLAMQNPLGYGLVEDSFKKMAKERWPEVSPNLSHSHSGWLDVALAVGFPGILLIFGAIAILLCRSPQIPAPWGSLIFWALISQVLLWITTEVSATVTFAALIFWISWSCGLVICAGCIHQKTSVN